MHPALMVGQMALGAGQLGLQAVNPIVQLMQWHAQRNDPLYHAITRQNIGLHNQMVEGGSPFAGAHEMLQNYHAQTADPHQNFTPLPAPVSPQMDLIDPAYAVPPSLPLIDNVMEQGLDALPFGGGLLGGDVGGASGGASQFNPALSQAQTGQSGPVFSPHPGLPWNASNRKSFQKGTPFVPETGQYQLHQGEAVVPQAQNPYATTQAGQPTPAPGVQPGQTMPKTGADMGAFGQSLLQGGLQGFLSGQPDPVGNFQNAAQHLNLPNMIGGLLGVQQPAQPAPQPAQPAEPQRPTRPTRETPQTRQDLAQQMRPGQAQRPEQRPAQPAPQPAQPAEPGGMSPWQELMNQRVSMPEDVQQQIIGQGTDQINLQYQDMLRRLHAQAGQLGALGQGAGMGMEREAELARMGQIGDLHRDVGMQAAMRNYGDLSQLAQLWDQQQQGPMDRHLMNQMAEWDFMRGLLGNVGQMPWAMNMPMNMGV